MASHRNLSVTGPLAWLLTLTTLSAAWAGETPIHAIQGAAHRSPLEGETVDDVRGVVTSTWKQGFTIQSPRGGGDGDDATSEGLTVALSGDRLPNIGDLVSVAGKVVERLPGDSSRNLGVTTLEATTWSVVDRRQPLPDPIVLGDGGLMPPLRNIDDDSDGDVGRGDETFDPDEDALDFYEARESMLVEVRDATIVDPTSRYGEIVVSIRADSRDGAPILPLLEDDPRTTRLVVDDKLVGVPHVHAGDLVQGSIVGILAYDWSIYRILATEPFMVHAGPMPRTMPPEPPEGALVIASYNVENLAPTSHQERLGRIAAQVVEHLHSPDVLALQEIQDDSGPEDDGVVDAGGTLDGLIEAIAAAGGPPYHALEIAPADGEDGGQPGGNIRVAYLVRKDRPILVVDAPQGAADEPTLPKRTADGGVALTHNPGRVAPQHDAWTESRKPLALHIEWQGWPLVLVNNHWQSKRGDEATFGARQPPRRHSERRRVPQAEVVGEFVDALLEVDPDAFVIVTGDFNDFEWSAPLTTLERGRLHNLTRDVPAGERYSYIYQGCAQTLDHMLVTPALQRAARSLWYQPVHLNAAFHDQVSDHDPLLLVVELPERTD